VTVIAVLQAMLAMLVGLTAMAMLVTLKAASVQAPAGLTCGELRAFGLLTSTSTIPG
jgi:hypothetical protein